MNIPQSLKEVLSEEDIKTIKEEFDKQVEIAVESRLIQYDEEAVKTTKKLIDTIHESYRVSISGLKDKIISKFNTIKENYNNRYEKLLKEDAEMFKVNLARGIEKLINENIENIVDFQTIKKAAKNNTASIVLDGLRRQLAVDSALMKESIAEPIKDVKNRVSKASAYIKRLNEENAKLTNEVREAKVKFLIESKVRNLPEDAANHMRRMLEDQDVDFINEQFDYILGLYKNSKETKREMLKEETISKTKKSRPSIFKTKDLIIPESKSTNSNYDLVDEIVEAMNKPLF